jgi:hypothetical protein
MGHVCYLTDLCDCLCDLFPLDKCVARLQIARRGPKQVNQYDDGCYGDCIFATS